MGFIVTCAETVEKGLESGQKSGIVKKTRNFVGAVLNTVGSFIQTTPPQPEPEEDSCSNGPQ